MKQFLGLLALASSAALFVHADDFTGYIVDKSCAGKKAMRTNEACFKTCTGRGDAAMFVTEDGKIYQVAEQDKVMSLGGKKVVVTGKITGETISVEKIAAKAD